MVAGALRNERLADDTGLARIRMKCRRAGRRDADLRAIVYKTGLRTVARRHRGAEARQPATADNDIIIVFDFLHGKFMG